MTFLWKKSCIFHVPQKIKGPGVTPCFTSNLERNTHRVQVVARVLKAVPIVVHGEGEVVIYCLLEKSGEEMKRHTSEPQDACRTTYSHVEGRWGGKGSSQ